MLVIRYSIAGVLLLLTASCNCGVPVEVKTLQTDDKNLSCKEVILEINETEFYLNEAKKSQGIAMDEALMPLCWLSGYLDGQNAVRAAQARINYLSNIYDLLECGGEGEGQAVVAPEMRRPTAGVQPQTFPGIGPYRAPLPPGAANSAPLSPSSPTTSGYPGTPLPPSVQAGQDMSMPNTKEQSGGFPTDPNVHIHILQDGSRKVHSHPHSGPHSH